MSSDTGEALTSPDMLRRIADAARGNSEGQQLIVVKLEGKKDDGFAKLKDAVFVVVVLAVGGFTFNNSINQAATNAKLETTLDLLQKSVDSLTQQVKELTRVKP